MTSPATALSGSDADRSRASAPSRPPARRLRLPGDKSISHRALMLAALADGESRIAGAGDGADVRSTAGDRGGARGDRRSASRATGRRSATGSSRRGADGLRRAATAILDCGNSGTSLRLISGMLAGLPLTAVLDGDDSLRRRPVARIIEPLRSMGAVLHGRRDDSLPPLTVVGRTPLRAIDYTTPVPSAQVKSAILLAGLRADGRTTVRESVATRDHTERMLRARGRAGRADGRGRWRRWRDSRRRDGGARRSTEQVPGDVSAAAFWLVAGAIHPDAELDIHDVGVNPTRRAVIDILRLDGRRHRRNGRPRRPARRRGRRAAGRPASSAHPTLHAIDLGPAEVAAAIDEIPILCLAAAAAEGTTVIRGAGELRHKESDRIAGTAAGLRALGAADRDRRRRPADHRRGRPSHGAETDSLDDHRLAMTFAIAGLIATGETTVGRPGSAAISYPGFFDDLERVRA